MCEYSNEEILKFRCGLALRLLLSSNKKHHSKTYLVNNTLQIANTIKKRPATISAIFNGQVLPESETLFKILKVMDKTVKDFGQIFDNLSLGEILEYAKKVEEKSKKFKKE